MVTVEQFEGAHFVMLWDFILTSSINDHEAHVKWVWVTMLLRCNSKGVLRATPSALARIANVPLDQTEAALVVLKAPDPTSTSPDHEGRRVIETSPNVWFVVNYEEYWRKASEQRKKDKTKARVRKHRAKKKEKCNAGDVTGNAPISVSVSVPVSVPFDEWWNVQVRKESKAEARKLWEGEKNTTTETKMTAADQRLCMERYPLHAAMWKKEKRTKEMVPHPRTWLYQRRWEDEIEGVESEIERTTREALAEGRAKVKCILNYSAAVLRAVMHQSGEVRTKTARHAEELDDLINQPLTPCDMLGAFYASHDGFVDSLYPDLSDEEKGGIDKRVSDGKKGGVKPETYRRYLIREVFGLPNPLDFDLDEEEGGGS